MSLETYKKKIYKNLNITASKIGSKHVIYDKEVWTFINNESNGEEINFK